jgi:hypothetical protein
MGPDNFFMETGMYYYKPVMCLSKQPTALITVAVIGQKRNGRFIYFLFIYDLFNDARCSLDSSASNDRIINELERLWNE